MIAGVCGGLGRYAGIDPVIVRIAFVLLTVPGGGIGLVLYALAWIVMPLEPAGEEARPPAPPPPSAGRPSGALVLGVALVAAGVLWLAHTLGASLPAWDVVLSVALIASGAALVAGARSGAHGGLIALGVALTLALSAGSAVDADFDGGFGERTERPVAVAETADGYRHWFGSLTVDLRNLELPQGTTTVDLSVVFGSLSVRLPEDVAVRVRSSVVLGRVDVLGQEVNGVDRESTHTSDGYAEAERRLSLDISAVLGSAEVRR